MTPAINALTEAAIPFQLHEYEHDPSNRHFGLEAVQKLALPAGQVFKTLVINVESDALAVAVIPVETTLNLKACAKQLGVKKARMAEADDIERSTGYLLGGISPIGQKKPLTTLIDERASHYENIFISGGRRGLEIELSPNDLCRITDASYASIGVSKK